MTQAARAQGTPTGAGQGDHANANRSQYLNATEEIVRVLKLLRDHRAEIQLRFEGEATAYTAKILDIGKKTFLLEDIQPREGLAGLRAGTPFAMAGRAQGIYVHCADNKVVKADAERGVPYFHVRLPRQVLFQQRRQSHRYRLPVRVAAKGASVTMFRDGAPDAPLVGRMIDISAGGCRAEFDNPGEPPVASDEQLESCAITIPNLLELSSKAAIRHFSYDKARNTLTCGIELTEMHVTDRRRLEQFIQTLARRQRR